MLPILEQIKAQQLTMNLTKEYKGGLDPNDAADITVVMIGGAKEDTEDTPIKMDDALVGFALKTYTVPTGKKLIPMKFVAVKQSVTTDKDVVISLSATATAKMSIHLQEGAQRIAEDYPFGDFEFAAADVINLYFVTLAGAAALVMGAYMVGLVVPV